MENTIFVDFDDTLCIHKNVIQTEKYLFMTAKDFSEHAYRNSKVNKPLVEVLKRFKEQDNRIVLLTEACSKALEAKKYWCTLNCGSGLINNYIATSGDVSKKQAIETYCNYYNLNAQLQLLIDDNATTRKEIEELGVKCVSPQYIMLSYINHIEITLDELNVW